MNNSVIFDFSYLAERPTALSRLSLSLSPLPSSDPPHPSVGGAMTAKQQAERARAVAGYLSGQPANPPGFPAPLHQVPRAKITLIRMTGSGRRSLQIYIDDGRGSNRTDIGSMIDDAAVVVVRSWGRRSTEEQRTAGEAVAAAIAASPSVRPCGQRARV